MFCRPHATECKIRDLQSVTSKSQLLDNAMPDADKALDCSENVSEQLAPADSECPLMSQQSESMSGFDEGVDSFQDAGPQCGPGHLVGPDVQELVSA